MEYYGLKEKTFLIGFNIRFSPVADLFHSPNRKMLHSQKIVRTTIWYGI